MAGSDGGVGLILIVLLSLLPAPVPVATVNNSLQSTTHPGVKWKLGEFGACPVVCGGGVQSRRIQCVRETRWYGRSRLYHLPAILCPLPSPPVTRPCNTHTCAAHWVKGNWSQCSSTCGIGTQAREVRCESSLWSGPSVQVSRADCGGSTPVTSRKCHVVDCPYGDEAEAHSIATEDYTLIQLRRSKKLTVNIGGTVKLLPGQTVVVKCPVKNYSRKLVYWSKGYKLVNFMGRVRAKAGGLQIRKANPSYDAGVYTCIAGDKTATITVRFVQKDDPLRKSYQTFARQATIRGEERHHKSLHNSKDKNDIFSFYGRKNPGELDQQRDQRFLSRRTLTYLPGKWSPCSATCGSTGHRKRKVSCSHVTSKYVKIVADEKCGQLKLPKPRTVEECGSGRECAVWRPGPWSKCRPSCGRLGHKTRYLVCEWQNSGLPAWSECSLSEKPTTRKPCKSRPCPKECDDGSRYCSLARLLNMCRYDSFRRQCCKTCHKHHNLTS